MKKKLLSMLLVSSMVCQDAEHRTRAGRRYLTSGAGMTSSRVDLTTIIQKWRPLQRISQLPR